MKVVHINQSDTSGGAAIAGFRLHEGLLSHGINSRLLVGTSKTTDKRIATIPTDYRLLNRWIRKITDPMGLNCVHNINSFSIDRHPFYQETDILHLHNLHCTRFSYLAIPRLARYKPTIFTLHDMWSFTGHCAYSLDCNRWRTGCGQCPYPNTYPSIRRDNTSLEWKLKKWVYSRSQLTIVVPSKWLAEVAKQSMLAHFPICHIPNGIDTEAYQPLNQDQCRNVLGISQHKNVLLFGAHNLEDPRKGFDLLQRALALLPASLKMETLLLTFGSSGGAIAKDAGLAYLNLGYVTNDRLKSIAYSAADLFLFPTRADNFPIVLQESLACGTPVVSFEVGGISELVRPGVTGYLAQLSSPRSFCDRIVALLEDHALRRQMASNGRRIVNEEYSLDLQVRRHIELYLDTLGTKHRTTEGLSIEEGQTLSMVSKATAVTGVAGDEPVNYIL